jgi:hypothetical protein
LLDEVDLDATEILANEPMSKADFFNCAGILKNRDIT